MISGELCLTPSRQTGTNGTIDSPPHWLPIATFEIRHLTFFHQDNELVWWEIIQGWFVSKLETVTEITRSNWRAQVWHTCVHGQVVRVRFWQLHGDRFSLVKKKRKKIIRGVKGLQECSLYTQQHGHCFALKENKVGNKSNIYIYMYTGAIYCTSNGPTDCATDFTNSYPSDRT